MLAVLAVAVFSTGAYGISIEQADMDAGSVFLNFDELAAGTVVSNQYAGYGLTISGTLGNNGSGAASTVTAEDTGGSYSDPIYIGQPNNSWDGSVIFDFTGVNVTQFGAYLVDSASSWLSLYDSSNTLIETIFGSGSVYDWVGADTGGVNIARAIFSGDFYAVDDVMFNAKVPEPGSLILFLAGLLGVVVSRRRIG
ncbi:hypothetical protein R50072_13100 [Simiduia litorea]